MNAQQIAQIVIAGSVIGVWVFRLDNIAREFREYGLPDLVRNAVGAAKIAMSTLLLAGLWYPSLVFWPAVVMALLMLAAQFAHVRARHAWQKYVASFVLLVLSAYVAYATRELIR